ncbi:MAG TPA: hypothetical protein VD863_12165 [Bradyrhizobium sp.]|jgi:hypothetical protein|nr:hypothetical protein [Bradyrhizobium sp.]
MVRVVTYARKSPEALEGLVVFAVRLVRMLMARAYAADFCWRQRLSGGKWGGNLVETGFNRVEQDAVVTP